MIITEKTAKRAIGKDDLINLAKLPLQPHSREWHARNYFMISFSLIGISFTDLAYLKQSNIVRDRIVYKRKKTHKQYDIKITALAKDLIGNYAGSSPDYLLPILPKNVSENSLDAKKVIAQWIKVTNKWLKRIGLQCNVALLTTYVSRHTWATTAKRLGYSNELIAEAMGHEYGNRITNIYLDNFEQSVIDDLNEKVIQGLL